MVAGTSPGLAHQAAGERVPVPGHTQTMPVQADCAEKCKRANGGDFFFLDQSHFLGGRCANFPGLEFGLWGVGDCANVNPLSLRQTPPPRQSPSTVDKLFPESAVQSRAYRCEVLERGE